MARLFPPFAALVLVFALACNAAELTPAPSMGGEGGTCPSAPVAFCDAGAPDAMTCGGDPDASDPAVRRIPQDGGYPLNCTVELPESYPDSYGQCSHATACRCLLDSHDGGAAGTHWDCHVQ